MQTITTIGLDIAKSVFQVYGVDADGRCCALDWALTIAHAVWYFAGVP
jgi:hypothetical protein